MGATVWKDTIYIDKKLSEKLTPRERKIILAHEICHIKRKDRLRKLAFLWFLPIISLFFLDAFSRHLEIIADKYAIIKTNDPEAFISLMDKLEHNDKSHPPKEYRINLARSYDDKHKRFN